MIVMEIWAQGLRTHRIWADEGILQGYGTMSQTRYTKQYQNDAWLYSIYRADDQSDYMLVAIFPGIGWQNVAIKLTDEEVHLLRCSEDKFTEFVLTITNDRNNPIIQERRIDSQIESQSQDELILEE